ncbi:tyrosine-protein phosphatase [Maribacter aestuarii]|uniref:tyrosine-protein phosphatase n=1 Tax=Maribacter aestuarii TaxID=1130723 RepID=UPI0025A56628|nr:CpsB/CapC family capsule biosynthesis tyrosine phosphatase [Maribacter aestuarii]
MFDFFSKKYYLVDELDGFVDIHNHIIPGIDDGAKNVQESVSLIKAFGAIGVENFICTPHIMSNYYPNDSNSIFEALDLLHIELERIGLKDVTLRASAEHMIDANFENLVQENKVLTLDENYLLMEMSYLQKSINFKQAVGKVKEKRLFPILAHPERYVYMHGSMSNYQKIKEQGVLFQLNMLSLGDYYGGEVKKATVQLLKSNQIDFIASDVHNERQFIYLKELTLSKNLLELVRPVIERTKYNFNP